MKFFERRSPAHLLLAASVALNLAALGYLTSFGGFRRVLMRMNLVDAPPERAGFQEELVARFRKLPSRPGEVIFAGDSLVADGAWPDYFSEIHTRAIGGETTSALLERLDEITEDKPRKLVLLIGANDLAFAVPPARLLANYRTILARVRVESPSTETIVIGLLPVNRTLPTGPVYDNAAVRSVNRRLEGLVGEFPRARFVDVGDLLVDEAGDLRPGYTTDGLHLRADGYLAIRGRIEAALLEGVRGRPPQESARP